MKQLLRVARLRYAEGRSYAEIAASLGIARSTVQAVVARFQAAGLRWPLPPEIDEDALYAQNKTVSGPLPEMGPPTSLPRRAFPVHVLRHLRIAAG